MHMQRETNNVTNEQYEKLLKLAGKAIYNMKAYDLEAQELVNSLVLQWYTRKVNIFSYGDGYIFKCFKYEIIKIIKLRNKEVGYVIFENDDYSSFTRLAIEADPSLSVEDSVMASLTINELPENIHVRIKYLDTVGYEVHEICKILNLDKLFVQWSLRTAIYENGEIRFKCIECGKTTNILSGRYTCGTCVYIPKFHIVEYHVRIGHKSAPWYLAKAIKSLTDRGLGGVNAALARCKNPNILRKYNQKLLQIGKPVVSTVQREKSTNTRSARSEKFEPTYRLGKKKVGRPKSQKPEPVTLTQDESIVQCHKTFVEVLFSDVPSASQGWKVRNGHKVHKERKNHDVTRNSFA